MTNRVLPIELQCPAHRGRAAEAGDRLQGAAAQGGTRRQGQVPSMESKQLFKVLRTAGGSSYAVRAPRQPLA